MSSQKPTSKCTSGRTAVVILLLVPVVSLMFFDRGARQYTMYISKSSFQTKNVVAETSSTSTFKSGAGKTKETDSLPPSVLPFITNTTPTSPTSPSISQTPTSTSVSPSSPSASSPTATTPNEGSATTLTPNPTEEEPTEVDVNVDLDVANRRIAVIANIGKRHLGSSFVSVSHARSILYPSWFLTQYGVPVGYDIPVPPTWSCNGHVDGNGGCDGGLTRMAMDPPYQPHNKSRVSRVPGDREGSFFNEWDGYFTLDGLKRPRWAVPLRKPADPSGNHTAATNERQPQAKKGVELFIRSFYDLLGSDNGLEQWAKYDCERIDASIPLRDQTAKCFHISNHVKNDQVACLGNYTHIVELPAIADLPHGSQYAPVLLPGFEDVLLRQLDRLKASEGQPVTTSQGSLKNTCPERVKIVNIRDGSNNVGVSPESLEKALVADCESDTKSYRKVAAKCRWNQKEVDKMDYFSNFNIDKVSEPAPSAASLKVFGRWLTRSATRATVGLPLLERFWPTVPFGPNLAGGIPSAAALPPSGDAGKRTQGTWLEPPLYERSLSRSSARAFVEFVMYFGPGVEIRDVPQVVGPKRRSQCKGGASTAAGQEWRERAKQRWADEGEDAIIPHWLRQPDVQREHHTELITADFRPYYELADEVVSAAPYPEHIVYRRPAKKAGATMATIVFCDDSANAKREIYALLYPSWHYVTRHLMRGPTDGGIQEKDIMSDEQSVKSAILSPITQSDIHKVGRQPGDWDRIDIIVYTKPNIIFKMANVMTECHVVLPQSMMDGVYAEEKMQAQLKTFADANDKRLHTGKAGEGAELARLVERLATERPEFKRGVCLLAPADFSQSVFRSAELHYGFQASLNIVTVPQTRHLLLQYDKVLRSDGDTFLGPYVRRFHSPDSPDGILPESNPASVTYRPVYFGRGSYSHTPWTWARIREHSARFGLKHHGMQNFGGSWFSEPELMMRTAPLLNAVAEQLLRRGKDEIAKWSDWWPAVSSMVATEIAVNHMVEPCDAGTDSIRPREGGFIDLESSGVSENPHIAHVHCWRTDHHFSKLALHRLSYSPEKFPLLDLRGGSSEGKDLRLAANYSAFIAMHYARLVTKMYDSKKRKK